MKLLFDARYIRTDFHDGISRYSTELGTALARITPVVFLIHDKKQLDLLPAGAEHLLIHAPTAAREPLTALILNKYTPDVVFSPMQTMGSLGRKFELILTSHDMIYYRHRKPPTSMAPAIRLGWRAYHASYVPQRLALNAANLVATVSETTKQDFIQTNLTKRPIVVIPNAPQQLGALLSGPVLSHNAPRHLIYMGSFMPYKNVETLIQAMELLPEHTLHLLSRISPERKAQLAKLLPAGAKIVFHNGVSDAEYASLLANAAILVSASKDEGYGLPLAEALALGVPAVVSELPIFHEVAGPGALYVPATDAAGFARAICQLDNDTLRADLIKNGQSHIAQYSWESSARTLLAAAESLL